MPTKSHSIFFVRRRGVLKPLGHLYKALRPKPGRKAGRLRDTAHLRRDVGLPPVAIPTVPEPPFPRN